MSDSWSKRSHKIGVAPATRSPSIFSGVRVMAAMTCLSATMSGSKRAPIAPVAPAKKIRIPLLALLSDYIASPHTIAEKNLRVNQAKVEWHPGELYPLGVSLDP